MSFLAPSAPAAPAPPPPPPSAPMLADSGIKQAGAAQRAAAAAANADGTIKTSSQGVADPTTTSGGKSLFGG